MTLSDTAAAVIRESGQPKALIDLLGLRFHKTPVLRPSTDFHDGHLYMTVLIERDETTTVGRGKKTEEVTKRVWTLLAVRDDRTFFLYDADSVTEEHFRYPSTVTTPSSQRWHPDDLQAWLLGDDQVIDPHELYNDLRDVYKQHVEYPDDIYYDIVPLYVLSSYVYRLFKATGYIHFNGTAASGKSQNLRLMTAFGLNPIWASSMTSASLFRSVAGAPGVICVDEAESFDSERGQELRQILLSGYADGAIAGRTEKGPGDRFVVVQYETYSPKVLASINPLDPVLASRCLIVPMAPAIRQIPDFDPADDRWQALRNRTYRWAMQEASNLADLRDSWTLERRAKEAPDIRSRAWEVAQAFLVLAEHVEPGLHTRLVTFFNDYFAKQAQAREEADRQYLLLKCLPRVLAEKHPHPGHYYGIKDIHEIVSGYLEEDAREYYRTKSVARHLTVLGFKDRKSARGGTLALLDENQIRTEFTKRHVTPFDEDAAWLAGTTSYQDGDYKPVAVFTTENEAYSWVDQYLDEEET